MGAADKLKEISQETHEVQELLDCALDEAISEQSLIAAVAHNQRRKDESLLDRMIDRYIRNISRMIAILNILRDKLCAIDGLQVSLLSELEAKENAPAERQL